MKKTAFIGHRDIQIGKVSKRLTEAVEEEIRNGCCAFTMGTHGDFDELALHVCRKLRKTYSDMQIDVVITSFSAVKNDHAQYGYPAPYADVNIVMYEIENTHFKRRILQSNRCMIDACDTLLCYVDTTQTQSGAYTAMRYAERKGLKIINLFRKEDHPFYNMTDEEIKAYWLKLSACVSKKEQ